MNIINVVVASQLKDVRMQKNVSVRKLAEMTGISRTYISDIENDKKIPTIYILCVIAVALDVRPEALYHYEKV